MHTLLFLFLLGVQIPGRPAETGTIEGLLLTSAGKPALGIRVAAMVPPENANDIFSANALSSIAETDAYGRYRLTGVPPGFGRATASRFFGVPGLSIPISIQVEGGAKVPVFQSGFYPVLCWGAARSSLDLH
jgi:hypothetical protein